MHSEFFLKARRNRSVTTRQITKPTNTVRMILSRQVEATTPRELEDALARPLSRKLIEDFLSNTHKTPTPGIARSGIQLIDSGGQIRVVSGSSLLKFGRLGGTRTVEFLAESASSAERGLSIAAAASDNKVAVKEIKAVNGKVRITIELPDTAADVAKEQLATAPGVTVPPEPPGVPPTITSVSPTSVNLVEVPISFPLTVLGANLSGTTGVFLDTFAEIGDEVPSLTLPALAITIISDTQLNAEIDINAAIAAIYDVRVITPFGETVLKNAVTLTGGLGNGPL